MSAADIERLAKVAKAADYPGHGEEYNAIVRAILTALREPSEEMERVGVEQFRLHDSRICSEDGTVEGIFTAMIDSLLEDK